MQLVVEQLAVKTLDELRAVFFGLPRSEGPATIPTAVDHAYDMIWAQLVQGRRRPGQRLTDTELATQFGLSRTPVRQALHRLAQDELVRLDARRGFFVRDFSADDVREIYDVRAALEALALRLGASHITTEQLQVQVELLHQVRARRHRGSDEATVLLYLESDLKLHNLIIQASGNGRLIRILAALRSQQALFQYWDTAYPERKEAATEEHERIVSALIANDTDQAVDHLIEHITRAKERVLADLFGETRRLDSSIVTSAPS
ncbi:MAG: GntR family transcriptional regulator [Chloroflexota bacterium]